MLPSIAVALSASLLSGCARTVLMITVRSMKKVWTQVISKTGLSATHLKVWLQPERQVCQYSQSFPGFLDLNLAKSYSDAA